MTETRFAACAVFTTYGLTMYRVRDRQTNRYVPTIPARFIAWGSAVKCAEQMNAELVATRLARRRAARAAVIGA